MIRDVATGAVKLLGSNDRYQPADAIVLDPSISGDGRVTAFVTHATNLLPGVSGNVMHVYVRDCEVASPMVFCNASVGASGCRGLMSFQGLPSVAAGSGFALRTDGIDAGQTGVLLYGKQGALAKPAFASFLCPKIAVLRAVRGWTGGTVACDGFLTVDFNAFITSGVDPELVAGQPVCAQTWFRNAAGQGQLSNAVAFLVEP